MDISRKIILNNEGYFQPRATIVEDKLLMTMQTISDSDYFGRFGFRRHKAIFKTSVFSKDGLYLCPNAKIP